MSDNQSRDEDLPATTKVDDDEKTRDAQIDLVSRQIAEAQGIPGHAPMIAGMAKAVLKMLPKWHVVARCDGCHYTEELVVQSYGDVEYNRRFYWNNYSGHKHPIVMTIEQVPDSMPTYTARCADCKRQHLKMDAPCSKQPKNAPRIGPQ